MSQISNKSFKICVQMKHVVRSDSKESPLIVKIKVKEISAFIREYHKRCQQSPHLVGRKSEINMLKNLLGRYQDPDDIITDHDFDMLVLILQSNKEKSPPKGLEKLNDWLCQQMTVNFNLSEHVKTDTSCLFNV